MINYRASKKEAGQLATEVRDAGAEARALDSLKSMPLAMRAATEAEEDVRATVVEQNSLNGRTVRFHIDAQLNVDPAPEVAFETLVELTTGRASIQNRDQAS